MAEAIKIHSNISAKVNEYQCEECGGIFVMLTTDTVAYCPLCGEDIDEEEKSDDK